MIRAHHWPVYLFGFITGAAYLISFVILDNLPTLHHPEVLTTATTLDLVVTIPLLYYLLLVRRKGFPVISVAPVFLASLFAASFILPADHQSTLHLLQLLIAPIELLLLGYVGVRVWRTTQHYRQHAEDADSDFYDRLLESLQSSLEVKAVAYILASEIGLLYYALFTWRQKALPKHNAFTYHLKSGYPSLVTGILVALLMEVFAMHVLLHLWSPTLAWVVTALTLYSGLWLLGDAQAARLRPIVVEKEALSIRIGLRWTIWVPFDVIAAVHPIGSATPSKKSNGYLEAVLLGKPQYLISLNEPVVARGLYGRTKHITTIGLAIDDAVSFESVLKRHYTAWQQD